MRILLVVIWVKLCFSLTRFGLWEAEEQWIGCSCFFFTSVFDSGSVGFCFCSRA